MDRGYKYFLSNDNFINKILDNKITTNNNNHKNDYKLEN